MGLESGQDGKVGEVCNPQMSSVAGIALVTANIVNIRREWRSTP